MILILPFIEPISRSFDPVFIGNTLATARPRFVITIPPGSRRSRMFKHLALNSVAVKTFSFGMWASIAYDQTDDQSVPMLRLA